MNDVKSFPSMTESDSHWNAGKKQKREYDLSLSYASSASFSENNSKHGDGSSDNRLVHNAILGKNVDRAVFGSDLMKIKQETRSIRGRLFSKTD